jgi:hypothetical protein
MEDRTHLYRAMAENAWLIVHFTRAWLHYGIISFAVLCSFIAALRGAVAP